jgi:hypothetical protein
VVTRVLYSGLTIRTTAERAAGAGISAVDLAAARDAADESPHAATGAAINAPSSTARMLVSQWAANIGLELVDGRQVARQGLQVGQRGFPVAPLGV